MEINQKKEIIQEWKNRHAEIGIVSVTCNATGESFLAISKDNVRFFNRHRFQLNAGMHPNKALQSLWKQYGPNRFTYSVVKELEYKDGEEGLNEKLEELFELCLFENSQAKKL